MALIIDPEQLTTFLSGIIPDYASLLGAGFEFGTVPTVKPTPDKSYTARTDVPVLYQKSPAGTVVTIAFAPGDATGNESDFPLDKVVIPERFPNDGNRTRFIPRKKTGFEVYFPFFTLTEGGVLFPHTGSLEVLTLSAETPPTITKARNLGLPPANYEILRLAQGQRHNLWPTLDFTTGYHADGTQFGSPHAIHHNPVFPAAVQMAGFLAVDDPSNPLWQCLALVESIRKQ